jgi:hypothetical protein
MDPSLMDRVVEPGLHGTRPTDDELENKYALFTTN